MYSNNPENDDCSTSPRSDMENQSFTQNIKTRLSNFFNPTKWFTTQASSNSNGIEEKEDYSQNRPHKKRRIDSARTTVNYTSSIDTTTVDASTNTDSTEFLTPVQGGMVTTPTPSPYSAHKESRNAGTNTDSSVFTNLVQGQVSLLTPSTYSENKEEKSNYSHRFSLSDNFNSVTRKRKSLCDPHDDYSPAHGSTFYPGETVYGGSSLHYMNRPNIIYKKNINLSDDKMNQDINISRDTKRVYNLLDDHSDPVSDAKRITLCTNKKDSTYKNSVMRAAKTQDLPSLSLSNILKFKKRQKAKLRNTTRFARQLIASRSSSARHVLPNHTSTNQDKKSKKTSTTKIKSKLSKPDFGTKAQETQTSLELPSNTLEIDMNNLPSSSTISAKPSNKEENPLKINTSETAVESDSITKFVNLDECRYPTYFVNNNLNKSSSSCEKKEPSNATDLSDCFTKQKDLDTSRRPRCMIKNGNSIESCVCCGEKKTEKGESSNSTVLTGSITKPNISVANENMSIAAPTLLPKLVNSQKDKWECPECYVRNEKNVNKCVSCDTVQPGLRGVTQNKGFNFSQTNKTVFKFGIIPTDYTATEIAVIPTSIAPAVTVVASTPLASVAPLSITECETSLVQEAAAEPEVYAVDLPITPTGVDNDEKRTSKLPEYFQDPDISIATEPAMNATSIINRDSSTNGLQIVPASIQAQNKFSFTTPPPPPPQGLHPPVINVITATPINNSSFLNVQVSASSSVADSPTPSNLSEISYVSNPVNTSQSFFQNNNLISNSATTTPQLFKISEANTQNSQPETGSSKLNITFTKNNPGTESIFNPPPFGTFNLAVQNENGWSGNTGVMNNILPGSALSIGNSMESKTASIFSAPLFGAQPSNNNIASNRPFNPAVQNENNSSSKTGVIFGATPFGSLSSNNFGGKRSFNLAVKNENSGTGIVNNIPGGALSTGNFMESRTSSIFSAPLFGAQPSNNNIASNRPFNLAVQNENDTNINTGVMINMIPGSALSTGNSMDARTSPIFSASAFGGPRSNNVLTGNTGMNNNRQTISENNLLGGHRSNASGFDTQMNSDAEPPLNSGVNRYSFTGNTSFKPLKLVPAPPTYTQTQQPDIFGSQLSANAGGILGSPRMPSTVVPTFDRNFANATGNTAVNFGIGSQTISGPFGPIETQSEQPNVYSFGSQSNSMVVSQVQFNMGTSPGSPPAARRFRKAVRRTPQRL